MVDILLATYNGEKYLAQQLESILEQDYSGWRILVADDGSDDKTVEVLRKYSGVLGDRLVWQGENARNLGPTQVFSALAGMSTAAYQMFCDQDDVWLPDKISKTLAAMRAAEARCGNNTPLLVHTDLRIVDSDLLTIAPSFWRYQKLEPGSGGKLNRLLSQNVVTGCTVMSNRALTDLAVPIPGGAAMHDWWLALVAVLFGEVVSLDEATMLYRQHGSNSIGAKGWGCRRIFMLARQSGEVRSSILRSVSQAQLLLACYRDRLPPGKLEMLEAYAALPLMSKFERIKNIFNHQFFKHGVVRNVGFIANVLMLGASLAKVNENVR